MVPDDTLHDGDLLEARQLLADGIAVCRDFLRLAHARDPAAVGAGANGAEAGSRDCLWRASPCAVSSKVTKPPVR